MINEELFQFLSVTSNQWVVVPNNLKLVMNCTSYLYNLWSAHFIVSDSENLFPNLKKFVTGKRFSLNEEIMAAVEGYFTDLSEYYFKTGIELLEKHWTKCIEVGGDYIEK